MMYKVLIAIMPHTKMLRLKNTSSCYPYKKHLRQY